MNQTEPNEAPAGKELVPTFAPKPHDERKHSRQSTQQFWRKSLHIVSVIPTFGGINPKNKKNETDNKLKTTDITTERV